MDSQMRKISDFYPWITESDLTNQFILCLDNNAFSGEFILHETIIKLLKDGQNVYIISTNHSRKHYEAILRKNAMDLKQLEAADRMHIHFLLVGDDQAQTSWAALEAWQVNGMCYPSERGQSKCIVIDDLDALEVFAPTALRSRLFISRLIQSVSRKSFKSSSSSIVSHVGRSSVGHSDSSVDGEDNQGARSKINTIVVYGHKQPSHNQEHSNGSSFFSSSVHMNSLGSGNNMYEPSLTEYCRYRCDVRVCVQALSSGYSSDVHGFFTVTQTPANCSSNTYRRNSGGDSSRGAVGSGRSGSGSGSAVQRLVVHYKALDSGVRCCLSNNT